MPLPQPLDDFDRVILGLVVYPRLLHIKLPSMAISALAPLSRPICRTDGGCSLLLLWLLHLWSLLGLDLYFISHRPRRDHGKSPPFHCVVEQDWWGVS